MLLLILLTIQKQYRNFILTFYLPILDNLLINHSPDLLAYLILVYY